MLQGIPNAIDVFQTDKWPGDIKDYSSGINAHAVSLLDLIFVADASKYTNQN